MSPALPNPAVRRLLAASRPLFASPRVPLPAKRRLVDVLTRGTLAPRGTRFERVVVGGVACERATPADASPRRVLVYLHGGGYALGSARAYRGFAARLAAEAGAAVVVPDYRLSPEHAHPAALDDAVAVVAALRGEDPDACLLVAGDSAGGGLALALAMTLRDRGAPPPAALGLICPWADLSVDADGSRKAGRDPLIRPAMLATWTAPYVGPGAATDPLISPVLGDLRDLPPIVLHSAGDDPLCADADRLEEVLAGSVVEHVRHPGLWHVFHLQCGVLADARAAVRAMGASLARHAGAEAPATAA